MGFLVGLAEGVFSVCLCKCIFGRTSALLSFSALLAMRGKNRSFMFILVKLNKNNHVLSWRESGDGRNRVDLEKERYRYCLDKREGSDR